MDSAGAIIAVVFVAIAIVGSLAGAQLAFETGGEQFSATEDFDTNGVGSEVILNQSNRDGVYYSADVNVENGSGVAMVPTSDYAWDDDNGTLTVESQSLANENGAAIGYGYQIPTETQGQVASLLSTVLGDMAVFVPLIFVLALVIIALGLLGSLS